MSYTTGVKRKLLREAGIPEDRISDYELDHIVPLAHDGAKRKDRLEVKLQCLVCTEQMTLEQAQEEIAEDWQAAYHRHGRTPCHR